MKILVIVLLSVTSVTVTARHKKEWQLINPTKLARERPQIFYKSDVPACTKGAGFYRDPQDCHQFVRCVDEFGTGRHFSVIVGRCEPGLVFDENVSACNWPELSAPCSNGPEKFHEVRKPFRPEQIPQDNVVYQEQKWDKQYPVQEEVLKEPQGQDVSEQKEVTAVQGFHIAAQEPVYQDQYPQVSGESQSSDGSFEDEIQKEVYQENIQEQVYQDNIQKAGVQEQIYQDKTQETIKEVKVSQRPSQDKQQEVIYQQPSNEDIFIDNARPEQVSSNGFQQVASQETQQFQIPNQAQQEQIPQEDQTQWWVPEDSPQHDLSKRADKMQTSENHQEPIFCSQEGFFRNPRNCSQFIRCVKLDDGAYAVHFFECPHQLVFSEKDLSCTVANNHSCRSNKRQKRQATNSNLKCKDEGFYRNPNDCRAFYRCVKTATGSYETHLFSCPANLVFDEEYTTCNWPEKAPPCNNQGQAYKPTRKPVRVSKPPNQQPSRTTNKPARTEKPYKPPSRTTSKPVRTERPYRQPSRTTSKPTRTEKPYRQPSRTTSKPTRTEKPYKQPARATSKPVRTEKPKYGEPSRTTKSPKKPGSDYFGLRQTTGRPRATTSSYETGPRCRREGFFRNDNDCSKFYKCVKRGNNYVRYELACPKNFAYDERSKTCLSQRYVSCNRNRPAYPPRQDDEETTTTTESSSTTSSNSQSGSNDDIVCEREGYFRNPKDCNQFYRCVDYNGNGEEFVRYDFKCPDGLVFDEANSVCNWPDQSAPCENSGGSGGGGGPSGGGDSSESGGNETGGSEEESGGNEEENDGNETGGNEGESGGNDTGENVPGGNEGNDERDSENEMSTSSGQSSTESSESSTSSSGGSNKESGGSGSENECNKEGFYRNPDDCNKFYRCVDFNGEGKEFVRYDFNCPEGLVFDEENSVCNWPADSAPCDTRAGSGNGGSESPGGQQSTTSGTNEDESESSQTTSSSSSSTRQTSEGTTESTTSSTTTRGSQTDSGESSSTTSESSTSSSSERDGSESTSDSSKGQSGGNDGECTKEGFYRNPEDCTKFYRCVDFNGDGQQFVRYDFDCPDGLVFDEVNSVCNWPDQSPPCDNKNSSSGSPSDKESSTSKTTDSQSSTEQSTQSATETSESSTQSSTEQTTERTTQSTTEQTTTSEAQSTTTSQADSTTTSQADSTTTSQAESTTSSQTQSTTTEGSKTTQSSSESSTKSGEECSEPGFFRCQDDCSKFYRCVENENGELVRYDFNCPDGLIFDDKNDRCDWPSEDLTCDNETSSSESSTSGSQTSTTASSYDSTTSSSDSTTSSSDSTTSSSDKQTTSATDSTTSSSDRSSTSSESTTSSSSNGCKEEGFFRNPDDCRKYYRCLDEGDGTLTREDFECAEDEVFDEEMRYCNRKDLAPPCDDSSSTTDSSSSSSTSQSTSSAQESTTSNSGSESTTSSSSSEQESTTSGTTAGSSEQESTTSSSTTSGTTAGSSEQESTTSSSTTTSSSETSDQGTTGSSSGTTSSSSSSGECTEEGFHRDPNDCNKFYRCVDFKGDGQSFTRYDFDCPEGLVFDETNDVCNWPSSVPSCESSGGSKNSSGSDSSTTESSSQSTSDSSGESSGTSDGSSSTTDSSSTSTSTTSSESGSSSESTTSSSTTESTTSQAQTSDSTSGSDGSSTDSGTSTSSDSGTTSSGGGGSRGSGSSSDNIECTEEGFFRHPDDCSKFYRCVDFAGTGESYVRYDFDCPDGLHFDEVNSVCNWPTMTPGCNDNKTRDSSGSKSDSDSSSTTSSGSTSDSSSSESSTESSGTTSQDSSSQSSSSDSSTDNSSGTTSQDSSTTSGDQTTSSSSSTTSSSSDEFQCEEEGYFKHPKDCKKYYECKRDEDTGELVKIDCECPDGQVWDNEGWYCNAEELSPPCDNNSSSSSSSFKCKEEGFFRDPEDCTKYYQCNKTGSGENDFKQEHHQCKDGLVFDEQGRYCNAPELSEPCDDSSSTTSGSTKDGSSDGTTSGGTTSGSSESTTSGQGSTDSSSNGGGSSTTSSAGTRGSSGSGECTQEGFFRNPDDCNKFYRCVDFSGSGESFVRYDFDCPEGLHFDEVNSVCNWPTMTPPCESKSSPPPE